MAKSLEQKLAAAEAQVARLSKQKRELARREEVRRRLALGAKIEAAGGEWLSNLAVDSLRSLLLAAKPVHDRTGGGDGR